MISMGTVTAPTIDVTRPTRSPTTAEVPVRVPQDETGTSSSSVSGVDDVCNKDISHEGVIQKIMNDFRAEPQVIRSTSPLPESIGKRIRENRYEK